MLPHCLLLTRGQELFIKMRINSFKDCEPLAYAGEVNLSWSNRREAPAQGAGVHAVSPVLRVPRPGQCHVRPTGTGDGAGRPRDASPSPSRDRGCGVPSGCSLSQGEARPTLRSSPNWKPASASHLTPAPRTGSAALEHQPRVLGSCVPSPQPSAFPAPLTVPPATGKTGSFSESSY